MPKQLFLLFVVLFTTPAIGQSTNRPSSGDSSESFVFASPNTLTGLSLEQATINLNSEAELAFRQTARRLLCNVNLTGHVWTALGSWSDGAENSMLVYTRTDIETLRYLSASLGQAGHQKSVLYFKTGRGTSFIYVTRISRKGRSIRDLANQLENLGIHNRTLVRSRGKITIFIVDPNRELRQPITRLARQIGSHVTVRTGTAVFLGDDSSAAVAQQRFDPLITSFESTHAVSTNRCDSTHVR